MDCWPQPFCELDQGGSAACLKQVVRPYQMGPYTSESNKTHAQASRSRQKALQIGRSQISLVSAAGSAERTSLAHESFLPLSVSHARKTNVLRRLQLSC